ncbi:forkhead box protein [Steccherinum ochraceum]|uniref:Forkhead box protein n=1 Tax=Steccherinum ochraceum TaxID=92696 RepID=A0A4R0RHK9_9APHY|nr:forkhead box protein [Steccherinum ochraceum]
MTIAQHRPHINLIAKDRTTRVLQGILLEVASRLLLNIATAKMSTPVKAVVHVAPAETVVAPPSPPPVQAEPVEAPSTRPPPPRHHVPPPFRYNNEHYPAYDANARRIGLDHVRYESLPPPENPQPRQYYRPRTHNYPAANASMKDLPHVMTMNLDINPARLGPPPSFASGQQGIDTGSSYSPVPSMYAPAASRTYKFVPLTYSPPSSLQTELDFGRTDRRVTTGRPTGVGLIHRDADGAPHLREMLGLGPNDAVDLKSLSDPPPGVKPSYPYPVLIQLAINGSTRKRLTLSEIYTAIEDRFEWFRTTEDKAWQGSIRHTLSLKSCFRTISRPITEPGKGNYWIVDFSMGDGNKRPRKRNPRPKKAERIRMAAEAARNDQDEDDYSDESAPEDDRPGMSRRRTYDDEDDPNIDPQLRQQGHNVGEGRAPSTQYEQREIVSEL